MHAMKVCEPLHGLYHYEYPRSIHWGNSSHPKHSIVVAHNGRNKADITGAHCPHEHGISQQYYKILDCGGRFWLTETGHVTAVNERSPLKVA